MSEYEEQSYNTTTQFASGQAGTLQIRLDTQKLLEDIELFLTGKIINIVVDENGRPQVTRKQITKPKANTTGIHSLLTWIQGTINTQVVQGNFPKWEDYETYIHEYHLSLAVNVMENLYEWEIKERDYNNIIDSVMIMVIPFMTRLVGNKERESYEGTMKVVERNTVATESGSGGISLFGGRRK